MASIANIVRYNQSLLGNSNTTANKVSDAGALVIGAGTATASVQKLAGLSNVSSNKVAVSNLSSIPNVSPNKIAINNAAMVLPHKTTSINDELLDSEKYNKDKHVDDDCNNVDVNTNHAVIADTASRVATQVASNVAAQTAHAVASKMASSTLASKMANDVATHLGNTGNKEGFIPCGGYGGYGGYGGHMWILWLVIVIIIFYLVYDNANKNKFY